MHGHFVTPVEWLHAHVQPPAALRHACAYATVVETPQTRTTMHTQTGPIPERASSPQDAVSHHFTPWLPPPGVVAHTRIRYATHVLCPSRDSPADVKCLPLTKEDQRRNPSSNMRKGVDRAAGLTMVAGHREHQPAQVLCWKVLLPMRTCKVEKGAERRGLVVQWWWRQQAAAAHAPKDRKCTYMDRGDEGRHTTPHTTRTRHNI